MSCAARPSARPPTDRPAIAAVMSVGHRALSPVAHQQVDQLENGVSDGRGDDDFQALVQNLFDHFRPVEHFEADVEQDHERDDLDRPVEQAKQQVGELLPGGPLLQPDAGEEIEEL
ncbi:MAG: hypothetical protein DME22_15255 [Verrucomicrobia bacterium]|nr:MAG: hypothetical protein DME22_15255 [Verrucomicrobiota bacterium]